tara:strand:- start:1307 stop:1555 length:249 start_codon:yes stop_codon:yes gene_type:complete
MNYNDEQIERIFELMMIVIESATGKFAPYAKNYAEHSWLAYMEDGNRGLEMQIPYVLSNLQGWRGDLARSTKAELKTFNRHC